MSGDRGARCRDMEQDGSSLGFAHFQLNRAYISRMATKRMGKSDILKNLGHSEDCAPLQ